MWRRRTVVALLQHMIHQQQLIHVEQTALQSKLQRFHRGRARLLTCAAFALRLFAASSSLPTLSSKLPAAEAPPLSTSSEEAPGAMALRRNGGSGAASTGVGGRW